MEILAVISHEFGHITRRRRLTLEILSAMGLVTGFTYVLALYSAPIIYLVAEVSLSLLVIGFVFWRAEYRADMEGAMRTGPEGLISIFELWKTKIRRDDGSETHPLLRKRIQRLETLLDGRL